MPARLVNIGHDTPLFLPLDVRQWMPSDHLVHFIMDAVSELGLRGAWVNERATGDEQYPPRRLLGPLIYSYATGLFTSWPIKRATHDRVAVRLLCADSLSVFFREQPGVGQPNPARTNASSKSAAYAAAIRRLPLAGKGRNRCAGLP